MRWAYDDDTRDLFGKGIHRDILIVPHATFVTPVPGGPPEITSKVPEYIWVPMPVPVWDETEKKIKIVTMQKPFPKKDDQGNVVRKDVEWVITNDDIVKEKFKYSNSLNSDDNLTFSSCNAAMVQFTIRNKKEYIAELDDEDEPTGNYYWEQEVPNLQKYEKVIKDPNGTTRKIVGELMSNACIKVYMYFNGDSSTLMYLGMFKVEEDKLIDNGYNRQITAYDFLAWFREIDIFYWYKHLFEGINKLGNDYEDYTNDTNSKEKHTKAEWDKNYIRDPKEKWTIGEALQDLIDHFAAYDMTVFEEEVINEETGDKAKVMKLGTTSTNQNEYGRDNYEEDNGYTGLGMPILLDPNVMTKGSKAYMPTEPGPDEKEQYGYMNILDLEFYANPAIMKTESLSAGKFLEDIGLLAGRYPYIRTDDLIDDDWIDPVTITPTEQEPHPSRYNTYEKCILTFKPLPSAENDKKVENIPESVFDNHDIVKGFQHDYYQTQDILVMKFELNDGTEIKYSKLNKSQLVAEQKSELQTFTITNNMFANYLVTKSDDDNVKKMLDKYKVIREKLFGKDSTAGNISPDALFNQGYNNIRNRIYTPYQLTTFADPVRDVGDRIKIDFTDMLTGEQSHFYTYILERSMEGIQKCMDTYTAKGTMKNPLFTNYQTSSKAKSGGDTGQTSEDLDIMTPFDLIEYMRNCGYRMLDEPSDCEAVFAKGSESSFGLYSRAQNHNGSWDQNQPTEGDTDTHGLKWYDSEKSTWNDITKEEPYDIFEGNVSSPYDIGMQNNIYWVYTTNGNWTMNNVSSKDCWDLYYDISGWNYDQEYNAYSKFPYDIQPYDLAPGDTTNVINVNGEDIEVQIGDFIAFTENPSMDIQYVYTGDYSYDTLGFDAYLKGLENFEYTDYTDYGHSEQKKYRIACYVEPGVWAIGFGSNIDNYRMLLSNTSGSDTYPLPSSPYYDSICSRYTITPAIKPGDTTNEIKVNNVPINIEPGFVINSRGDSHSYGDYYYHYTNLCSDEWLIHDDDPFFYWNDVWNRSQTRYDAIYMYPGVWVKAMNEDIAYYNSNPQHGSKALDNIEVINYWLSQSSNQTKPYVQLKWSDPPDIDTWEPYPCAWEGTVIVRKENSAPLHRWDGEKVVVNKTRDKYKTKGYKDEDIKMGRTYYYGFFPYYTADDSDSDHPIRYYTFTKVIKVETGDNSIASTIDSIDVNGNTAVINYTLSQPDSATFSSIKIYGKIGSNPSCDDTDDVVVNVDDGSSSKDISGLNYESTYYFCLVTVDSNDEELSSNIESCTPVNPVPADLQPYVDKLKLVYCSSEDNASLTYYANWAGGGGGSISSNYSWITSSNFNVWANYNEFYIMNIGTINVSTSGSNVTVSYNFTNAADNTLSVTYKDMYGRYNTYSGNYARLIRIAGTTLYTASGDLYNYNSGPSMTTSFNSMLSCVQYLSQHFRHCNLKVDGADWVIIE